MLASAGQPHPGRVQLETVQARMDQEIVSEVQEREDDDNRDEEAQDAVTNDVLLQAHSYSPPFEGCRKAAEDLRNSDLM
jgi:hypothetical protein